MPKTSLLIPLEFSLQALPASSGTYKGKCFQSEDGYFMALKAGSLTAEWKGLVTLLFLCRAARTQPALSADLVLQGLSSLVKQSPLDPIPGWGRNPLEK